MSTQYPYDPILIIDDEEAILLSFDTILQMAGITNVITCSDPRQVMDLVVEHPPCLVLLDLNMPHINGEAIIDELTSRYPKVVIIVITGRIDAETAVNCMKSGAADYLVKPVDEEKLLAVVKKGLVNAAQPTAEESSANSGYTHKNAFAPIITSSPKMYQLFSYIESVATTEQPLLIKGETGTGKELMARAAHDTSGRSGPFIAVNVAGLDDNIFSDTLFGHLRGAFTGADRERIGLIEKAANGTLFLDEIGDLSPASQVKLLRLLQENEYMPLGSDTVRHSKARIIASTHVNLWEEQEKGNFREDLHYRLRTHRLRIPPLRERREDLPCLIEYFLDHAAATLNRNRPKVPPELLQLLNTYMFPGNIRELQAMIFDAVAQHQGSILSLTTFREHISNMRNLQQTGDTPGHLPSPHGYKGTEPLPSIKQATAMLIEEAMERANNNQSIAASLLGISQQALSKRLKQQSKKTK